MKTLIFVLLMSVMFGGCVSQPYQYSNPAGVSPVIYNGAKYRPIVPGVIDQAISVTRTEISGKLAREVRRGISSIFK